MSPLFLSLLFRPSQEPKGFVVDFPQQVTKMQMLDVPDGEITVDGKTTKIKGMSVSETEISWEVFDIWALRLDTSVEEQVKDPQSKGADAVSRPSRPYAVIFTGFGHHGYPANCMSSLNAQEFCKWLSKRTGKTFRIPTVAEWRYLCEAGNKEAPNVDASAWTWDNADDVTHELGKKTPNAWGIKDMLGNVSEWASDTEGKYVVCGGSFKDKVATISSTKVDQYNPKWNEADPQNPKSKWWLANGQHIGLRIICIK